MPILDSARLRRFVDTFTRAGLHTIEGGHFAVRRGPGFSVVLDGPPASSPAGDADIRAIASALRGEIDRNGWRGRWIQHVADEPRPETAADYRIVTGMVRKYLPGVPVMDAIEDHELVGSVDIWCPKCNAYQGSREAYDALRAAGDRVWFYTCCEPGGKWLNRLLDMELVRVYPGKGGPWSSVRLASRREGSCRPPLRPQVTAGGVLPADLSGNALIDTVSIAYAGATQW